MTRRHSLPPLKALYAFNSAAAHLNFSKAADELCVTAAAVSHHVRLLERIMGVTLFQRLPRGLQLTREGVALQEACDTAFGGLSSVVDALSSGPGLQEVRVASVPHYSARVLFPGRLRFAARYPQFKLEIQHTLDVPEFGDGKSDFAILFGKGGWPGLEAELLFNCRTAPACAPALVEREKIAAIEDLTRIPVLLDDACFSGIWRDWFSAAGQGGWERLRFIPCNDIHALLVAAVDGHGLVMEPDFVIARQLADGSLVTPFPLALENYGYWLVYPQASLQKHACREFRSWLIAQANAEAERLKGPPAPPLSQGQSAGILRS